VDGPGGLFAPWTDHPGELLELRLRFTAVLNRLGRIEDELSELHNDITALIQRVAEEES